MMTPSNQRVPHPSRFSKGGNSDCERRDPEAESRRPARLRVYQTPRNPTQRDRAILTLLAEGLTQRQAAAHLGIRPRCVNSALANMRECYAAGSNEALIALAVRLQWIELAIEIHHDETPHHRNRPKVDPKYHSDCVKNPSGSDLPRKATRATPSTGAYRLSTGP